MTAILAHFYNEEFLLPIWLNHHKQYFDHGILIDYNSTDRSVEIIRDICPTWEIVKSRNQMFAAQDVDQEIMEYEKLIKGWKIALNITEFLVGPINNIIKNTKLNRLIIPQISFFDWDPNGKLCLDKKLWEQKIYGIDYLTDINFRGSRSFHNHDIKYPTGRHFYTYNCNDLLIFHYANCISCNEMLNRRLQIQYKIPDSDTIKHRGFQHKVLNKTLQEKDIYEFNLKYKTKIKNQHTNIKSVFNNVY